MYGGEDFHLSFPALGRSFHLKWKLLPVELLEIKRPGTSHEIHNIW